jgi:hypothetical protein
MNNLAFLAGAAALALASAPAGAQSASIGSRPWLPPPSPDSGHRMHGFHGNFIIVERDYVPVIERVVVREVPVAPAPVAAPPPPPREPFVIGRNYRSLPGACLKLIEGGASYYRCNGDWYRQVGAQYRAVARP